MAEMLKHRVADLRAASSVLDLLAGAPRVLEMGTRSCLVIDLCDAYQMRLDSNHPRDARRSGDGLDWSHVRRLKIIAIDKE